MEEKGYPHIDEEEDVGMCCEPMAETVVDTSVRTTKLADGSTLVHDWIDDLDWDCFPSSELCRANKLQWRLKG